MTFAYVILFCSVVGFIALAAHIITKRGSLYTSIPALIWYAFSIALYSARIIDAQDGAINATLYNDLSNSLRLYSMFVLFAYAWLLK